MLNLTIGLDAETSKSLILAIQLVAFGCEEIIKIGTRTSSGVQPPCQPEPNGILAQRELCCKAQTVLLSSRIM